MAAPITIEGPTLTPEQEQEKWLGEAIAQVEVKAQALRAALSQTEVLPVLKCCSLMLGELRTSMLSPQNYYELFMKVFDELHAVQSFFINAVTSGVIEAEHLYATVQHAGNIVPRLYMLILAGVVYIKTKAARANDILNDLLEMCKGVQHPTRGLFLRHFLLSSTKNLLPDTGNEFEGKGGDVNTSINFVLKNFREMVWLWFRMEAKSGIANKTRRDRERRELRVPVGYNLVRLSQLDGVDKNIYAETILPEALSIVLEYKEPIAQQYLMEVIVQVFPDEYHLFTLPELLAVIPQLAAGVNAQAVLAPLMDRIGKYVASLRDGTAEGGSKKEERAIRNMFGVFMEVIQRLASSNDYSAIFSSSACVEALSALARLAIRAYDAAYDKIDDVLRTAASYLSQRSTGTVDDATYKNLRRMLEYVAEQLADPAIILDLENFVPAVNALPFYHRRVLASAFIGTIAKSGKRVDTIERVGRLFDVIAPIVKDVEDRAAAPEEGEEFVEEQNMVCRALHLIHTEDLALLSKIYTGVRKQLIAGGMNRMKITLKAMSSLYLRLALRVKKAAAGGADPGVSIQKLFAQVHGGGKGLLEALTPEIPLDAFNLYLLAANTADTCELADESYDLISSAMAIYEEHAADSKLQMSMLTRMISSTAMFRTMPEETYDNIATKLCQYSSKLVQKPSQSLMVMQCSHLFWKKALSEASHKRVTECMQRSLKIADGCAGAPQLSLFVEAANHYLYYYSAQMPLVTPKTVNAVLELGKDTLASSERSDPSVVSSATFLKNTTKYVSARRTEEGGDPRWQSITP